MKKIKAWAIVNKKNNFNKARFEYGLWSFPIFSSQYRAKEQLKLIDNPTKFKIIPIEIKPL